MEENKEQRAAEGGFSALPVAPPTDRAEAETVIDLSALEEKPIAPSVAEDPIFRRILLFLSTALLLVASVRLVGQLVPIPYFVSALIHGVLLLLFFVCRKTFCPHVEVRYFFRSPRRTRRSLYALPPLVFGVMAIAGLGFLITSIGKESTLSPTTENPFLLLLFSVLLPAITEELFCRGIVLRALRPYGTTTAVILSSFVFAFLHSDPFAIMYAFCAGIVLGSLTLYTHSVLPAMFLHFTVNATAGFFLYLPASFVLPLYLLVMVGALAVSLVFHKGVLRPFRHIRKDSGNLSARENVKTALLSPLGAVFLMLLVFSAILSL